MGSVGDAILVLALTVRFESGRVISLPPMEMTLLFIVGIGMGGGGGTDGMKGVGRIGMVGMNPDSRFLRVGIVLLMLGAGSSSDFWLISWPNPTRITVESLPVLDTSIWFPLPDSDTLPVHLSRVIVSPVMLVAVSSDPACVL